MTCILSTPRLIAADRRIKDDSGERSRMVKVVQNRHIIAAVAGLAADALAVKRAVQAGASTAADLAEIVGGDSYALVLEPSGRRWRVEGWEVWPVHATAPEAIGSGADAALGYLAGHAARTGRKAVPPKLARAAVRFASKRRDDCGDGVDVRSFIPARRGS